MMKKILFLLFIPIFFSGCFAIVEEDTSTKRVKSFIIPKEEVLDTLQRIEEQHPRYEYEFYIIEGSRSQN